MRSSIVVRSARTFRPQKRRYRRQRGTWRGNDMAGSPVLMTTHDSAQVRLYQVLRESGLILQEIGDHQTGVDVRIGCGREQPGLMPARPRVRVGVHGQKPRLGAV